MNNHKFITTIERNPGMNESSPLIFGSNDCCCSVSKSCPTLCDPMGCSTPGFLVLHHLPEFDQTNIHWVGDAIPAHPLSSPCPPACNLSQHQGLIQWVDSSHQVAEVLELQHQSLQWLFRVDFLLIGFWLFAFPSGGTRGRYCGKMVQARVPKVLSLGCKASCPFGLGEL